MINSVTVISPADIADADLGSKLIAALAQGVNGGNPQTIGRGMAAALSCQHRTLQQGVISAIKVMLEQYAADTTKHGTDLRNASAAAYARMVSEVADERMVPGPLPLI